MDRATATSRVVRKVGILGIGLDSGDGHTHITRGDNFYLMGGSEETHKMLQDQVTWFNIELARRGKTIEDATEADIDEIASQLK